MEAAKKDYIQKLEFLTHALQEQYTVNNLDEFLRGWFFSFPFPAWVKNTNLTMVAVNPAYTQEYGITLEEYAGLKDEDAWKLQDFNALDRAVMKEERSKIKIETLFNRKVGRRQTVVVCKWPLYIDGALIGPAGFCLELEGLPDAGQ